jgi:hypothetical protein
MMVFDPGHHQNDGDWSDEFFSEGVTFGGWTELWVEGHDLWQRLMRLSPHSGRTD